MTDSEYTEDRTRPKQKKERGQDRGQDRCSSSRVGCEW